MKAQDDANVFGKVGTSGPEFQKALTGKKVTGVGQQGKYFWLVVNGDHQLEDAKSSKDAHGFAATSCLPLWHDR